MKRPLLSGASGLVLLAFAGSSFAGTPGPADLKAVTGNLGPTVEALATGLGNTANALIPATGEKPSAVAVSAALGQTVVKTGQALVKGAPNLASLGLLFYLGNSSAQATLNPILTAIDNPTTANVKAALAPQDLNTIVGNLQGVPFALIEGSGESLIAPYGSGLRAASIELLQGNIVEPTINQGGAFYASTTLLTPAVILIQGTNYQPLKTALVFGNLGVLTAARPVFKKLEGPANKLADAGAPLTKPVIGILKKGF